MLSIPSTIQDLLETGRFSIRYLIRFELDSGPAGVWNDTFALAYGGITYTPLAGNMEITEIPATSQLDSDRVSVTVGYLSNDVVTIVATEAWHQRPCTLFLAFMDDAGNAQHVMARCAGFLDDVTISDADGDKCILTLTIESNNRELNRSNGRTRSDADQRRTLSTDGFFKHAANAAADSAIYWGRKGPQYPTSAK
jgi:hypothetical protein